ncbi:MAG: ATP-binding protein [Desertifilum sp.]|nr:ATP-binding protein [Desertifilum sp.]
MSGDKVQKGIKEDFAKLFENPSRESLRQLLANNTGEYDDLDFKGEWIDSSKLAKHIIGMANKSGGVIIFGVDESDNQLITKGIVLDDKTDFKKNINKFIPEQLKYEVIDFSYEDSEYPKIKDKSFRVIVIEYDPKHIPFMAKKPGKDIKHNVIYTRKNTSTVPVEYPDIQDILNRRLETGFSSKRELSIQEHFEELKLMYSLVSKISTSNFTASMEMYKWFKNPKYPQEDIEDFVVRMIEVKKEVIESIVRRIHY